MACLAKVWSLWSTRNMISTRFNHKINQPDCGASNAQFGSHELCRRAREFKCNLPCIPSLSYNSEKCTRISYIRGAKTYITAWCAHHRMLNCCEQNRWAGKSWVSAVFAGLWTQPQINSKCDRQKWYTHRARVKAVRDGEHAWPKNRSIVNKELSISHLQVQRGEDSMKPPS